MSVDDDVDDEDDDDERLPVIFNTRRQTMVAVSRIANRMKTITCEPMADICGSGCGSVIMSEKLPIA